MTSQPLDLDAIEARATERRTRYAAAMAKRDGDTWPNQYEGDEHDYRRRADAAMAVADAEQAALKAEVDRLRAALTAIRHLHKDSPMGPCPVCIDADAVAAGRDGLMPYPCPTGRLAGAQDFDPPHVRAAQVAEPAGRPTTESATEPFRFVDDDGDYLHIGIPHTPANGGPAVSFHTATEPVHVPVDRIEELITVLRRLVAAQPAARPSV